MKKIKRIVLIDDDEITCYLHKIMLESMGVAPQIDCVHDGVHALQYFQENYSGPSNNPEDLDLVILDVNMPFMDGFEVLEGLKAIPALDTSRFAVVVLSSSTSKRDASKVALYQDLVHNYLPKPLTIVQVHNLVDAITKGKKA